MACDEPIEALFDRTADFAALVAQAHHTPTDAAEASRLARRPRKTFEQLRAVDLFAGQAQRQASEAVTELEQRVARRDAPDEPRMQAVALPRVNHGTFRARRWATRCSPKVDRLASAWLIRRFIDCHAKFLWLADPADCPRDAVGFDFDGAAFTHLGARVTFETLLAAVGLVSPALMLAAAGVFESLYQAFDKEAATRARKRRRRWVSPRHCAFG